MKSKSLSVGSFHRNLVKLFLISDVLLAVNNHKICQDGHFRVFPFIFMIILSGIIYSEGPVYIRAVCLLVDS